MGHKSPVVQTQVGGVVLDCGHRELHQFLVSVRYCRHKKQTNKKIHLVKVLPKWIDTVDLWFLSPPFSLAPALSNSHCRAGEGGDPASDDPRPLTARSGFWLLQGHCICLRRAQNRGFQFLGLIHCTSSMLGRIAHAHLSLPQTGTNGIETPVFVEVLSPGSSLPWFWESCYPAVPAGRLQSTGSCLLLPAPLSLRSRCFLHLL